MNILQIDYTLKHRSLDIYVSGCNTHCFGCHNEESWDFFKGEKYNEEYFTKIKTYITDFNTLIDNIMIFGGEPLDNNVNDLEELLNDMKTLEKKIWLFTSKKLMYVPENIKNLCHYIKTGKYIEELTCNNNISFGIKLVTSNQKIHKIK